MAEQKSARTGKKSEAGSRAADIKGMEPSLETMPRLISGKQVAEMLADFMGKKAGSELTKLMKIPKEVYLFRSGSNFVLSDKKDFRPLNMLKALFGGPGKREASLDAGYGMEIRQSTGHSYILFVDTSRRIAVKTTLSSMYEGESGWAGFRDALKKVLERAKKIPKKDKKTIVIYDMDAVGIADVSDY